MTLDEFREVTRLDGWRDFYDEIEHKNLNEQSIEQFRTYWIEAGHRIREQINNDRDLVILLRRLLPRYKGGSLILYRGENLARWEDKKVGLAWTTDIKVAKMFAEGINSTPKGGLLLKGLISAEAIISEPGAHSKYLNESQYTVDPALVSEVDILEVFNPVC